MPLPTPNGEPKDEFVSSCMANDTMKEEFPDKGQRLAVCNNQYKAKGFEEQDIVHAISTMLPGDELPEDIQYLPPGTHNITATKNGKPAELTVDVGAETAELLQNSFTTITAGDKEQVFIDFNHDDSEASGWITGFYWAGADPEAGGVRAKVEWTKAGEEALQGRNFRKFSPTFTLNSKGEIEGTTLNAGGLVNRPAFKDITPIVASDGEYQKTDSNMAEIIEEKKKEEVLNQDDSKKKEEVSAQEKLAEVKKENETLKAKIKALEGDKEKEQEVAAQAAVDKATEDGRIPPKDENVKAKWVSILLNDPSAIMALDALPVTPAFQRVVQAKRQEDGSIDTNGEAQMRAAKEYQAKNSSSFEQAWEATRYERPQLFN
jgi:phage I-like protein